MWKYRKFCAISYLKSGFPLHGCFNAKNACVNVDHPELNEDEPVIFSLHRKILPGNDRTGYPIPIDGPGILAGLIDDTPCSIVHSTCVIVQVFGMADVHPSMEGIRWEDFMSL
jgi:hypothetical protein